MNYADVKEVLRITNKDDWIANNELGTFTYQGRFESQNRTGRN